MNIFKISSLSILILMGFIYNISCQHPQQQQQQLNSQQPSEKSNKQWQPLVPFNNNNDQNNNNQQQQQQQQPSGPSNNGLGTLIGSFVNNGYDQPRPQPQPQPQPAYPHPQPAPVHPVQPIQPIYPQPVPLPGPVPVPVIPIAPYPIQQPTITNNGETIIENLIGGIPFDCRGKPTGHWRDNRFCDIFHACVYGMQRKTYACPFVGERTYFDEVTKRCEFFSKNPFGCSLNAYYH